MKQMTNEEVIAESKNHFNLILVPSSGFSKVSVKGRDDIRWTDIGQVTEEQAKYLTSLGIKQFLVD